MSQLTGIRRILALHARRYPRWEIQDAVRLLQQSEFGSARPVPDREQLAGELSQAAAEQYAPRYMVEALGDGLCRFHLDPHRLTEADLPLTELCLKASRIPEGSSLGLWEKLGLLAGMARAEAGSRAGDQVEFFLTRWAEEGCPRLEHSEPYLDAYHPHYLLMDRQLGAWGPALLAVSRAMAATDGPVVVAVDGRCASGKSTFAQRLGTLTDCNVFHMDDYFLPEDRQTADRLSEPGGNVDYERAEAELFAPLSRGKDVTVRAFDCSTQTLGEPRTVPFRRLSVVEGSYALHPRLAPYAGVRLFFTCDPQIQLKRLAARESPEQLERFSASWIPLEEAYFELLDIPGSCDAVIDTGRLPVQTP